MSKTTIHKRNELVRGFDDYSLNAKKALNVVYYFVQKHKLYNRNYFLLSFSTLRNKMNLDNDNRYVEKMKEALDELMETIHLHNWTSPIDGNTYSWLATRFINEVRFYKKNGEWIAQIEVNNTIKELMQLKGNFTKLDLVPYMNKFRTKYAMKLYEFLKSFEGYQYIQVSQKHTMKLLGIDENDTTNKHYSALKRLIDRQLKDIIKNTDLKEIKREDSKELSKVKIYKIYINPKSKKVPKIIDIEKSINDIIKKF